MELKNKYKLITEHIEALAVGTKISVRKIALDFEVSEGTAYRAIKEAESMGIVSTKRRAGTIRVEKQEVRQIEQLTFEEIVNFVDGEVLSGAKGLNKTLNKFVIGAMQLEAMVKYIESGNLLIVGNRVKAHLTAINLGAAVLITGGFGTTDEVKQLANELDLPIISTTYDTFTASTMIYRAIEAIQIKKKIILVEDIFHKDTPINFLTTKNTVGDMEEFVEKTNHTRYPVLDNHQRPIGIVTTKDIIGADSQQNIVEVMTHNPFTVTLKSSIALAAHVMIWESIELLPVINDEKQLIAVISREDVMKAMQTIQQQPQTSETYEVQIWSNFEEIRNHEEKLLFRGTIRPEMTNFEGMVSEGILSVLISRAAYRTVQIFKKSGFIVDSASHYFLVPLQIDDTIDIVPTIIELNRKFCKIDLEVIRNDKLIARSILTARIL